MSFPVTSLIAPAAFPPTHFVASPNWYSEFPVALCTADSKPFFRAAKGFDDGGGGAALFASADSSFSWGVGAAHRWELGLGGAYCSETTRAAQRLARAYLEIMALQRTPAPQRFQFLPRDEGDLKSVVIRRRQRRQTPKPE